VFHRLGLPSAIVHLDVGLAFIPHRSKASRRCGRKEVDPIHIVDPRNPLRRWG